MQRRDHNRALIHSISHPAGLDCKDEKAREHNGANPALPPRIRDDLELGSFDFKWRPTRASYKVKFKRSGYEIS